MDEEIRDELTPFEAYDAIPLCPTCFTETDEDWDFCPVCNAPLGRFVGYDPLNRIYTMRFLLYTGVTRPTHRIIFVGIWLYYLVETMVWLFARSNFQASATQTLSSAIVGIIFVAPCGWGLYLVTRNRIRLTRNRSNPEDEDHDEAQ